MKFLVTESCTEFPKIKDLTHSGDAFFFFDGDSLYICFNEGLQVLNILYNFILHPPIDDIK